MKDKRFYDQLIFIQLLQDWKHLLYDYTTFLLFRSVPDQILCPVPAPEHQNRILLSAYPLYLLRHYHFHLL